VVKEVSLGQSNRFAGDIAPAVIDNAVRRVQTGVSKPEPLACG
jgi:hypothetical protein